MDHLLHKHHYEKLFCCYVAPVGSFLGVICLHLPAVAGSLLETQSVRLQTPVFPVGTLVPLPTLWHFDGAGIGLSQGARCPARLPKNVGCLLAFLSLFASCIFLPVSVGLIAYRAILCRFGWALWRSSRFVSWRHSCAARQVSFFPAFWPVRFCSVEVLPRCLKGSLP